ncbi:MAG: glutathione S-transferase, partial [Mesorhizobium sp.]
MKLFDGGRAPNPRRVRVFLAEKGLTVPLVPVDMGALEHRKEPVASRNALRRLPVLELDDGTIITESIAICRYFEELHPEPALFGTGALGKAMV